MSEGSMPMGVGVDQRSLITMSPSEVDALLAFSRVMTMCTLNVEQVVSWDHRKLPQG